MRRSIILLLFSALILTIGQPVLADPITLPPGFVDELAVGGLLAPRGFAFAPDGRIFIIERGSASSNDINYGSVRVFKNGALLDERALTIDICGDGERGLLGIAIDPNFATNGYLYLYYTRQNLPGTPTLTTCNYNSYILGYDHGTHNRVSRFTMVDDAIDPATERVLIDNIVSDVGLHNAGDLHFGADGYLYISTGDGGRNLLPKETNNLNGKILRIQPLAGPAGGYSTTGNPFDGAVGGRLCGQYPPPPSGPEPCREVFAYGLRNPFRFTIQPVMPGIPGDGSTPFVGDVGGGAWEEVDLIVPGANYGYDDREGNCGPGVFAPPCNPNDPPPPGYTNPIYAYEHDINGTPDAAIIGGDFITGSEYPIEYIGDYFYGDFVWGFIRRLKYDGSVWNPVSGDFATGINGLIGLKSGPDDNLYYLSFMSDTERTSALRRIADGVNSAPVAQISVNKTHGPVPGTVYTFSAAGSYDPDNDPPLMYNWDFCGAPPVSTPSLTIQRQFTTAVNCIVTLTVTDAGSATSEPVSLTVYPGNTPATGQIVLNNVTSPGRALFYMGDTWGYDVANATDPDPGAPPLTDSAYSWSIVFHHQDHTHPFIPEVSGQSGQFTLPDAGEPDPVIWYRVFLRITDDRGQVTTIQQDLNPAKVTLTLMTNPLGGKITESSTGATSPTPRTVTRVVGLRTTISVPDTLTVGAVTYPFVRWSDGGAQSHTFVVPSANTTYTAFYSPTTPPIRTYFQSEPVVLTWSTISSATGYEVQIDDELGFIQPQHTSSLIPAGTLTYTAPPLPDGLYYWRVRARKADGITFGPYSPAEAFTLSAG